MLWGYSISDKPDIFYDGSFTSPYSSVSVKCSANLASSFFCSDSSSAAMACVSIISLSIYDSITTARSRFNRKKEPSRISRMQKVAGTKGVELTTVRLNSNSDHASSVST